MDMEKIKLLRQQLNQEMKKPHRKWDNKKIEELNEELFKLLLDEGELKEDIEVKQRRLMQNAVISRQEVKKQRRTALQRRLTPIAACLAVVLGLNQWSLSALGMNGFQAVYRYTTRGIGFGEDKADDNDPYGIRAKCAEYGIDYPIPRYIPDGFELCEVTESSSRLSFNFEKKEEGKEQAESPRIMFAYYVDYKNENLGIPTDEKNYEEVHINGEMFMVGKEDGQYRALWSDNRVLFFLSTLNTDYSESESVLRNAA